MPVEIRVLRADDDRGMFRSGDESLDLFFHRFAGQNQFKHHVGVTYLAVEGSRILGFATMRAVEGESLARPAATMMFLPIGSVPEAGGYL